MENTTYGVNSVDYIDDNIGWVAGGLIFNSTNGGNNWVIQKDSVKVNDVSFYDSMNGIAVGNNGEF
ncbi:MAG: hypothetical protein IPI19_15005 [Ignavibacteriales bacterium]|nr:hypothetical protein [Ignavibacteriales bacterium]